MAGQAAHDAANLVCRQRPAGPSRSHQKVTANPFLIHGDQNSTQKFSILNSQFSMRQRHQKETGWEDIKN
jgi:hypothetical protein